MSCLRCQTYLATRRAPGSGTTRSPPHPGSRPASPCGVDNHKYYYYYYFYYYYYYFYYYYYNYYYYYYYYYFYCYYYYYYYYFYYYYYYYVCGWGRSYFGPLSTAVFGPKLIKTKTHTLERTPMHADILKQSQITVPSRPPPDTRLVSRQGRSHPRETSRQGCCRGATII